MNRARLYINIKLLLLAVLTLNLSGCELDERVDDLTGGYEGAFIDRLTGEKVATEYYGAKLKFPCSITHFLKEHIAIPKYTLPVIKYGRTDRSLSWIPFMVIFVVLRKWT